MAEPTASIISGSVSLVHSRSNTADTAVTGNKKAADLTVEELRNMPAPGFVNEKLVWNPSTPEERREILQEHEEQANSEASTADIAALLNVTDGEGRVDPLRFEANRLVMQNPNADGADITGLTDDFVNSPEFGQNAEPLSRHINALLSPVQQAAFEAELDKRNILESKLERGWERLAEFTSNTGSSASKAVSDTLADMHRTLDRSVNDPTASWLERGSAVLTREAVELLQTAKGFSAGALDQALDIIGDTVDLAQLGYQLTTSEDHRDALLGMAKVYLTEVKDDPSKPLTDLQKAGEQALQQFEDGLATARAEGREAEYLAEYGGAAAVEVVAIVVPVSKLAKLGKAAKLLDDLTPGNLSKLKATLTDLAQVAQKGTQEATQAVRQALGGMLGIARSKGELTAFVEALRETKNLDIMLDAGKFSSDELSSLAKTGTISADELYKGLKGVENGLDLSLPPEGKKVNGAGLSRGKIYNLVGKVAEARAVHMLIKEDYKDIVTIQNNSGYGIDLVARNKDGKIVFFEVKATLSEPVSGKELPLSKAQEKPDFVVDRLERAIDAKGHWKNVDPATQKRANTLINEIRDGNVTAQKLDVYLDEKGALIKINRVDWSQKLEIKY